ncbi:tetratricopeptide repeat protein [Seonamhaeicola maritimus]|uniref:Tetratricopeptide repeat protein n=1 Tax=Seonamhaeicola maritimus TaxID=2591822 RepID=A0A5C7GJQ5_9FLAO|nr:hypothetical protein [Seonamhaeicola maritimus]TXG37435.1 hypothetical protein FUA22_12855 [Seonamhaeicola maritimus]
MEDKNYILFESYLSGELSSDEVAAFELRLNTEPEFNQAFNTYKELSSFLENKLENEEASAAFEANLKKISDKHFSKDELVSEGKQKSKVFKFYKYAVAASVIFFLGLFTFNQFSNPTYSDFDNHGAISLTVRGEQNQQDLIKIAEEAFNAGDYINAEEALIDLIKQDVENIELKLYQAITSIELNKFDVADNLLEDIKNGNSAFKHKATWYHGLSKLKQKDHKACVDILKTLPEHADDYEDAQALIKKLD